MSDIIIDSKNKNKKLGRGLGSLLGDNSTPQATALATQNEPLNTPKVVESHPLSTSATLSMETSASIESSRAGKAPEGAIIQIGVEKLMPSPYQPRSLFQKDRLEELSKSIQTSGILQPILVREISGNRFEIVAGERRWRAAQLAGLHSVPVIVKKFSDKETLEVAIVENLQRENLNPIEEAEALQRLMDEFSLTQVELADRVGKERATVANALRILQLSVVVRDMIAEQKLSAGHAKVLLSVSDVKDQLQLANWVVEKQISVRELEKKIKASKAEPTSQPEQKIDLEKMKQALSIKSLQEELQRWLKTKVEVQYQDGKGKILLHFYSDAELNSITDRLRE